MAKRLSALAAALVAAVCLTAGRAEAQPADSEAQAWAFGVMGGLSASPDRFIVGGHIESPALSQRLLDRVTLRPTLTLGFGDGDTLIEASLEFVLWLPLPETDWSVYMAAGPGISRVTFGGQGGADVGGVVNFGVGFQHSGGLFAGLKYQTGEARVFGGFSFGG